jgi:hypothetical protein
MTLAIRPEFAACMCLARVIRPTRGPKWPKERSPGFTLGSSPTRISPEGATRCGDNRLGTFEPDRVRVSSPFSISNPENRVFFMERTFMCLVRAKHIFPTNPG